MQGYNASQDADAGHLAHQVSQLSGQLQAAQAATAAAQHEVQHLKYKQQVNAKQPHLGHKHNPDRSCTFRCYDDCIQNIHRYVLNAQLHA